MRCIIQIFTSRYPSSDNLYEHAFVQTRARLFSKRGFQVKVFVPSAKKSSKLDGGVTVIRAPANQIIQEMDVNEPVYLHLLNLQFIGPTRTLSLYKFIFKNCNNLTIYFHGSEVQSYSPYLFDFSWSFREVGKFMYKNFLYMPVLRQIFKSRKNEIKAIAPSNWMWHEAEKQLNLKLRPRNIVPNSIENVFFEQFDANAERRDTEIIMVRPLTSKKYAVDIGLLIFSKLPEDYKLTIYGKGILKSELLNLADTLKISDRITFIDHFIEPKAMPQLFAKFRFALMPTRMDAQGVTMCQMAAAGCFVITTQSTAIPEFITADYGICLTDQDIQNFDRPLEAIVSAPNSSLRSKSSLLSICSEDETISKELQTLLS